MSLIAQDSQSALNRNEVPPVQLSRENDRCGGGTEDRQLLDQSLKRRDSIDRGPEDKRLCSRHVMALEDFVERLHSLFESSIILRLDDYAKIYMQRPAQGGEIDLRSISANHTALFQTLHSLGYCGS